jgi:alanine dehydrogenase
MAIQVGATFLEEPRGGLGILLSGVPGVAPGKVVIIGGGTVGTNAAYVASGMGADVVVLDRSLNVLRRLVAEFGARVKTEFSTQDAIEQHVTSADLVVGSVLIPGAAAPKLVNRQMVGRMKKGAVMVDVAIDQGGCFETSRPTTHAEPVFQVDGVIHYCVTNMPGAVPRTSAFALNNATLPFVLELAGRGWRQALLADPHLRNGLNVYSGNVTCEAVAGAQGLDYHEPLGLLRATLSA